MRGENTKKKPVVDLRQHDGVQKQGESEEVVAVLLSDGSGNWLDIVPGSFHFYVTGDPQKGEKAIPFIQFKLRNGDEVECFPTSCAAFKYRRNGNG